MDLNGGALESCLRRCHCSKTWAGTMRGCAVNARHTAVLCQSFGTPYAGRDFGQTPQRVFFVENMSMAFHEAGPGSSMIVHDGGVILWYDWPICPSTDVFWRGGAGRGGAGRGGGHLSPAVASCKSSLLACTGNEPNNLPSSRGTKPLRLVFPHSRTNSWVVFGTSADHHREAIVFRGLGVSSE